MSNLARFHFYTRSEAEQLVGLVFELVYTFFGVPDGTRGRVVDIRPVPRVLGIGYELVVEWDLTGVQPTGGHSDQPLPRRTCLSKPEMERYMQRVEKAHLATGRKRESEPGKRGRKPRAPQ